MSRIRAKNTKPELLVRKFLFSKGFRFRVNDKRYPGKPDIVFPKYRTVIFVHGCFWHGHEGCRYFVIPKTKTDWWLSKISTNRMNDNKAIRQLHDSGWKVIEVWECDLKKPKLENSLQNLAHILRQQNSL